MELKTTYWKLLILIFMVVLFSILQNEAIDFLVSLGAILVIAVLGATLGYVLFILILYKLKKWRREEYIAEQIDKAYEKHYGANYSSKSSDNDCYSYICSDSSSGNDCSSCDCSSCDSGCN